MLRVFVGVLFVAAGILHFTHTSTLVGVMAGMPYPGLHRTAVLATGVPELELTAWFCSSFQANQQSSLAAASLHLPWWC
eukprot:gene22172-3903_t